MSTDKVIDKVRKLLRLAESANVHEAAAAAARAQALMEQHRIERAQLQEQPEERRVVADWDTSLDDAPSLDDLPVWQIRLAQAVARVNGCRVFLADGGGAAICLIGAEEDREASMALYAWLRGEVARLMDASRPRRARGRDRRVYEESFGDGAVGAIGESLALAVAEVRRAALAGATGGDVGCTSLAPVDHALATLEARDAEAAQLYDEMCPDDHEREVTFDWRAYFAGRAAGKTIEPQGFRSRLDDGGA